MRFQCIECGSYDCIWRGDSVFCNRCNKSVRARKAFPTNLWHKILRWRDFIFYNNIKWEAV